MTLRKNIIVFALCLFACSCIFAQNKVKMMSYNLLNFNNYTNYCTQANNNHVNKAGYLATIVSNQQPDILACCEVGKTQSLQYSISYILGNSLNINGVTRWAAANAAGNEYLNNALFYDKTKFKLTGQQNIQTSVRLVNVYKLMNLASGDTLKVIVAHLKAGYEYAGDRADMVDDIMNKLQQQGNNDNYVICGDFNVYSASEAAFQKLVNPSYTRIAFYDPVDMMGDWNSNYRFSDVHTQSTHDDSNNDCFSYGGMDDRFDFILMSGSIIDGTKGITYKNGSYWAVGQDGNRYNRAINSPTNITLPENVIDALYNMSDHLPVVAEFYFGTAGIATESTDKDFYAIVPTPVNNELIFKTRTDQPKKMTVTLYSSVGNIILSKEIVAEHNREFCFDISNLNNGVYILNFTGGSVFKSYKIVKSN